MNTLPTKEQSFELMANMRRFLDYVEALMKLRDENGGDYCGFSFTEKTQLIANLNEMFVKHNFGIELRFSGKQQVEPTAPLSFVYRNWRGEISLRNVQPMSFWFGRTQWHPEDQWFLKAVDTRNNEERDFAFKDIMSTNNVQLTVD